MDILELDAQYKRKAAGNKRTMLLRLLPFLVSCTIYFIILLPEPSLKSTVVKCFPTFSLAFFVATQSKNGGVFKPYSRWIFHGLLFACVGDACLVWPEFFLAGMGAFAICHICYIAAFSRAPLQPLTFLVIQGLVAVNYVVILLPCLSGFYTWAVLFYSGLLGVMTWRALSCSKRLASAGSLVFIVSDMLVAHDKFCTPHPLARVLYMSSYYLAQTLIALSVDSPKFSSKEN
ncbi:lysoplasmalogenase TMEM86B [Pantherophis guttatus]|uniref:lysoplasmalogenase n=1 Tax=Pantherophis guttatus TaxID=94885 RepID=A0A6P9C906_PANGU|nr:lysoplasmalogenase TMEM86B [Pantherophis guttatus]XP_060548771.1 lysoplasmalogenase TMEM86B [Pantherophis guttatus]